MTSGPMPINALPPEPRPDPQVVAWMRAHRSNLPDHLDLVSMRLRTIKAYRGGHPGCRLSLADLGDAYREAARKPLTVADIPAGQDGASLYVDGESGAVMYRTTGGRSVPVPAMWVPTDDDGIEALNAALAALAATLPTVTTEETP